MKTDRKLPTWAAHWRYWGYAIGSDERYKPRWYERRAYFMGLRDAARIAECGRYNAGVDSTPRKFGRLLIQSFHCRAFRRVFGITPPTEQIGPGSI